MVINAHSESVGTDEAANAEDQSNEIGLAEELLVSEPEKSMNLLRPLARWCATQREVCEHCVVARVRGRRAISRIHAACRRNSGSTRRALAGRSLQSLGLCKRIARTCSQRSFTERNFPGAQTLWRVKKHTLY